MNTYRYVYVLSYANDHAGREHFLDSNRITSRFVIGLGVAEEDRSLEVGLNEAQLTVPSAPFRRLLTYNECSRVAVAAVEAALLPCRHRVGVCAVVSQKEHTKLVVRTE